MGECVYVCLGGGGVIPCMSSATVGYARNPVVDELGRSIAMCRPISHWPIIKSVGHADCGVAVDVH